MLNDNLEELGLSIGESKVYIALIKLGSSTVGPISKSSGVSYSKIYEVLNRLVEKGLASVTVKQKTKYYQPLEPIRLTEYLDIQEDKIRKKRQLLKNLLPELMDIANKGSFHEAEIFIGLKGLKTAYDLLVKNTTKPIYFTYVFDEQHQIIIDKFYGDLSHYKKHQWRGIATKDYKFTHFTKTMHKNIKFKTVPFPLPATVDISDDKVLQTAWSGKPVGILIHSKEIADLWRNYCEDIWERY